MSFLCFDVPKVVRSPGYDHGHDEESRNGRGIKIDILECCVWTSEWFRVSSGIYRSTRGVTGTPQGVYGSYWALVGERRRQPRWGRPPKPNPNWGGGRPPFPSSSTPTRKGGNLLLLGVGLPPWACHERAGPPLLHSFIYGGGGHPIDTQVDCLAVCGAPLHRISLRSYCCSA